MLYTSFPHDLNSNQLVDLIENMFRVEEVRYLACNAERFFSLLKNIKNKVMDMSKSVRNACLYV